MKQTTNIKHIINQTEMTELADHYLGYADDPKFFAYVKNTTHYHLYYNNEVTGVYELLDKNHCEVQDDNKIQRP